MLRRLQSPGHAKMGLGKWAMVRGKLQCHIMAITEEFIESKACILKYFVFKSTDKSKIVFRNSPNKFLKVSKSKGGFRSVFWKRTLYSEVSFFAQRLLYKLANCYFWAIKTQSWMNNAKILYQHFLKFRELTFIMQVLRNTVYGGKKYVEI